MKTTEITHTSLIDAGFQPCIFAPIYFTKYTYYLGDLNWSLAPPANNLNWEDATMLIVVSADEKSYINFSDHKRFHTIEEIVEYCKEKGIEMKASLSPLMQEKYQKKTEL